MAKQFTTWLCETCGATARVVHDQPDGVWDVAMAIADSHKATAPECVTDLRAIRIVPPVGPAREGTEK